MEPSRVNAAKRPSGEPPQASLVSTLGQAPDHSSSSIGFAKVSLGRTRPLQSVGGQPLLVDVGLSFFSGRLCCTIFEGWGLVFRSSARASEVV